MSLLQRLFGRKPAAPKNEAETISITDADRWLDAFGGGRVASGVLVNEATSMRFSAVFACVRLIGGAIASAPCKVYKANMQDARRLAANHPAAQMLRIRPNRFMTAATFWKYMGQAKILQGNAFAHIVRERSGKAVAMFPINPRNVAVYWAWEIGLDKLPGVERNRLFYRVTWEDGAQSMIDQDDMLHIPNVGWDGKRGMSTITAAAQGIGLGLAAEESSASFFSNGMQSSLALKYPNKLTPEAIEVIREHIGDRYAGAHNHHKPLVLTEGGDVVRLSMTADDAQLIQSRQFSVIDICRFFGVPPVMVGETEKTSSWGSGVEQMARWFTTFTLNDHLTAFEQELEVKIFRGDGHVAEFDESELTRGDTKTRGEFYRIARGSMQEPGFMTVNEIRTSEGLAPVEGGDAIQRPQEQPAGGGTGAA